MNSTAIHISTADHEVLRMLLQRAASAPLPAHEHLAAELDRALIVDAAARPAGTVGLNTRVRLLDLDSGETEEHVLCLPAAADADRKRLSVLAPVGIGLLGYHVGDEIEWATPGGQRRLRILSALPEPPPAHPILAGFRPS